MLHAVVLAGGSGARFWPLSRELNPKQMLTVFGGVSLMTRAINRVSPFIDGGGIYVVTSERLFDELRNHLKAQPELADSPIEYLVEPSARNTAAAVALAAAALLKKDPDAVMIMLPSDHLLREDQVWRDTMSVAIRMAEAGRLVTIGLKPSSPETGYGYIHQGDVLNGFASGGIEGREVAEFVEKPSAELAQRFVADGGYLWNSGMLVARCDVILDELEKAGDAARTPESSHGRTIADAARSLVAMPEDHWLSDEGRALYDSLPAVPFDKAALEVSSVVAVVPTELDWSDVGSLLAIQGLAEPDERGNVLVGRCVDVDSHDVLAYSADRLVATLGVSDVLVIDTPDATLVAAKDRAQDVRGVVDLLKSMNAPEVVSSRFSLRPWGSWSLLWKGDGFHMKSIDVLPGHRLSLQSHVHRSEHWIVVAGSAHVVRDHEAIDVVAGESVFLPAGSVHRLENTSDDMLKVIEVAVGEYLGEDDIVRYEDDFGR